MGSFRPVEQCSSHSPKSVAKNMTVQHSPFGQFNCISSL